MNYEGMTIGDVRDILHRIIDRMKSLHESVPVEGHDEFHAAVNGVLVLNHGTAMALSTAHNATIRAALDTFEIILMDLLQGRPDDDRSTVYWSALEALHGAKP